MLDEVLFLNRVNITCRPIQVAYVGSVFQMNASISSQDGEYAKHSYLRKGKYKRDSNSGILAWKVTAWCAAHADGVVSPYYFDNEAIRGADYYQMLEI